MYTCGIGTFEKESLSAQVIKRRQSGAFTIIGSDVMGFPTDIRGENLSVPATQSAHSTPGRELQRMGTSDPINREHSGEIWESKKSSPSAIKRTNQQVTASFPLYPLMNQSAPRSSRSSKIKGEHSGPKAE
ncbi:hypothetical protein PV325_005456 [Microctonus aethiopoides]|nr:hypothetical protein PV325_005456 [Microctonus aethiopoides]